MKKTRKWLSLLLAGLMLGSISMSAACGDKDKGNSESTSATSETSETTETTETVVWTTYGTRKFMRTADYSAEYGNKTLKIAAFRNEKEAGQILFKSNTDGSYTVKLNDLKSASGATLSKDAINVFHEKFITIDVVYDKGAPTGAGDYTDALVPYENIVEYGENTFNAGDNQAIYVEVEADAEQEAGVYTGTFELTIAGEKHEVPVEVEIYDYTLSETTHIKQKFSANQVDIPLGEMNGTVDMMRAYNDFFLDHRISRSGLVSDLCGDYRLEDNPVYLDDIVAAAKDPRETIFGIPVTSTTVKGYDLEGKQVNIATLDKVTYTKWIAAIAQLSIEEGMSLFKKAHTYMTWCDEYERQANGAAKLYYSYTAVHEADAAMEEWARGNASKTVKGDDGKSVTHAALEKPDDMSQADFDALKQEIADDLQNITHVVTGISLTSLEAYCEARDFTPPALSFCPTVDKYANPTAVQSMHDYANTYGGEVWTYTCVNPYNPYPTYHIEDVLVSARLLPWMMYDYDIVGNLFWGTAYYSYIGWSVSSGMYQVQDYYQEPLRFPEMNGDGWLVYPGRQYGVYGPVASVRLKAICDGAEDYDLFYELEDFYKERGASAEDFESVFKYMSKGMYYTDDVRVDYTGTPEEAMYENRGLLAQLLSMASNAGVVIENVDKSGNDVKVRISASEGVALTANGGALTAKSTADGVSAYEYTMTLSGTENTFALKAVANGKTYETTLKLGVESKKIATSALTSTMSGYVDSTTVTKTTDTKDGVEYVKVDMKDAEGPSMLVDASSLNIDSPYNYITLTVYNYGSEKVTLGVRAKTTGGKLYNEIGSFELEVGANEITISLASLLMKVNGGVDSFRFDTESNSVLGYSEWTLEE